MKCVQYVALLATLILGLSLGAFAKDKNEGKFTLGDTAEVGSTQLKPGEYKVEWQGSGDAVQVKILQGKKVVATSTAKLVEQKKPAATDSVTLDNQTSAKILREIDFGNRKESLVFGGARTSQGS
jgi:hypothetical protein